jgi:hypothetical protein
MARTKSPAVRREPSDIHMQSNGVIHRDGYSADEIPTMIDNKLAADVSAELPTSPVAVLKAPKKKSNVLIGAFCVMGIYVSLYALGPFQFAKCDKL